MHMAIFSPGIWPSALLPSTSYIPCSQRISRQPGVAAAPSWERLVEAVHGEGQEAGRSHKDLSSCFQAETSMLPGNNFPTLCPQQVFLQDKTCSRDAGWSRRGMEAASIEQWCPCTDSPCSPQILAWVAPPLCPGAAPSMEQAEMSSLSRSLRITHPGCGKQTIMSPSCLHPAKGGMGAAAHTCTHIHECTSTDICAHTHIYRSAHSYRHMHMHPCICI